MRTRTLFVLAAATCCVAARCGGPSQQSAGGDVADTAELRPADYKLTSDNYNKWVRAQWALDTVDLRDAPRIDARHVTHAELDTLSDALENNPSARKAIEDAGLSVKDFVLTTVALAQTWDAKSPGAPGIAASPENVAFLTERATRDSTARVPPRAPFLVNDGESVGGDVRRDDDSDGEPEGHGHGRGHWKHGKGHGKHGRGHD